MSTVLKSLNQALHTALQQDEQVIILGEDVLDPYGGAFKVTQGISTAFPERTITTPVSEAGMIGVATGLALRGFRPVVEIMFGDFITLISDQVINHAAKFRQMYNDQVQVPLVIRTPMGGRRGYGPTHSQTLEKMFLGVPGIKILAPNRFIDPGGLLLHAIFGEHDPVLFIENKLQYAQMISDVNDLQEIDINELPAESTQISPELIDAPSPAISLSIRGASEPQVTVGTYGYMADLCRQAALQLAYEDEIFIEVIVYSQLIPVDIAPLAASLQKSHRLLVVEEGTRSSGWGAEILASCIEKYRGQFQVADRVASQDSTIPASNQLESEVLPNVDDIINAIKKMV